MAQRYRQPNLKRILWTSIVILDTGETACILTAETIDLIFYRHSLYISIPLSLLAGMVLCYKLINTQKSAYFHLPTCGA